MNSSRLICPAQKIYRYAIVLAALVCIARLAGAQPFTVQGPGVNSNDFRVTTFASGLNFPIGMVKLPDDSLLVAVTDGTTFGGTAGRLIRLADTNQNGVADGPATTLYSGLPGSLTDVKAAGNLFLVTGDDKPITVLRRGVLPSDALTLVGQLILNYPPARQHSATTLCARKTPGHTNHFDILFQLGAEFNFTATTNSIGLTNSNIPGATGVLAGDAVHMITLIDDGASVTATNLIQLASGLRNASGITFNPATGDLYLGENGIDTPGSNEAFSADELNFLARTNLGGAVEFFGFPTNYSAYRSNVVVGGAGIQPLVAFRPIPNFATGRENEGVNQTAFAPPGFPNGLNTGVFAGFHGKFSSGGTANEENPVAYADPATGSYFHFIPGQQSGIGHLDGLMATRDSLFVADMVTSGNLFSGGGAGVIYQIKSLVMPPPVLAGRPVGGSLELRWDRGELQQADSVGGPWTPVPDAVSPHPVIPSSPRKFFRARY